MYAEIFDIVHLWRLGWIKYQECGPRGYSLQPEEHYWPIFAELAQGKGNAQDDPQLLQTQKITFTRT